MECSEDGAAVVVLGLNEKLRGLAVTMDHRSKLYVTYRRKTEFSVAIPNRCSKLLFLKKKAWWALHGRRELRGREQER